MSWKAGNHACFLLLPAYLTITSAPFAWSQNAVPIDKVVSVTPDLAHGSITIATNTKNPLPAPQIQYLPGPDGKTILVADFEGINYELATHVLKPENMAPDAWRQSSIQDIRIGQFSSQPPTMRISIGAFNAHAFRSLAFQARSGALVVKWATASASQSNQVSQAEERRKTAAKSSLPARGATPLGVAQVAPDFHAKAANISEYDTASGARLNKEDPVKTAKLPRLESKTKTSALPPQLSSQTEKNNWLAKSNAAAASVSKLKEDQVLYKSTGTEGTTEPAATRRAAKGTATVATAASFKSATADLEKSAVSTASDIADIVIAINSIESKNAFGSADVAVKADRKLNYKVFRLHEPERYVIDFDGLPALTTATLPKIEDDLLVKGMRTGTPDDSGLTQRLVLDLKDNTVDVADVISENGNALMLHIRPSGSAPLPTNLKASLIKDKLIVLDAGHGGSDPGAQRAGVSEKDLTMQITGQLKKRLAQLGARVVMTRADDTFVSLEDRVKITNEIQPDLFVSIHINALESTSSIYGIETYYQTDQSRPLAAAIHQQLVQGLGVPDRSIRKARFYVINHTAVPAILAEVGFISNEQERDNLGNSDYQVKIADSVSAGIVQYLTEKQELAGKNGKTAF